MHQPKRPFEKGHQDISLAAWKFIYRTYLGNLYMQPSLRINCQLILQKQNTIFRQHWWLKVCNLCKIQSQIVSACAISNTHRFSWASFWQCQLACSAKLTQAWVSSSFTTTPAEPTEAVKMATPTGDIFRPSTRTRTYAFVWNLGDRNLPRIGTFWGNLGDLKRFLVLSCLNCPSDGTPLKFRVLHLCSGHWRNNKRIELSPFQLTTSTV